MSTIVKVFGASVFVVGLFSLADGYALFRDGTQFGMLYGLVPALLLIFAGVFTFRDVDEGNMIRAIGRYAVAIGLSNVILGIQYYYNHSLFDFVLAVIMFVLGLGLASTGISYLRGTSKKIFRLILINGILLVSLVLGVWFNGISLNASDLFSLVMIILYLFFIGMLLSPQVRHSTRHAKIKAMIKGHR